MTGPEGHGYFLEALVVPVIISAKGARKQTIASLIRYATLRSRNEAMFVFCYYYWNSLSPIRALSFVTPFSRSQG